MDPGLRRDDGLDINPTARYLRIVILVCCKEQKKEQNEFDVSPSGYGIYWPLIDEDISIDGLLDVDHSNWLPAPEGPFWIVLRTYGPGKAILDKSWKLPPVKQAK